MKNLLKITISDHSGSRHFHIDKSIGRWLMRVLLLAVVFLPLSGSYNYLQHKKNLRLLSNGVEVQQHRAVTEAAHWELAQIESAVGFDGDGSGNLDQRIRELGNFYNTKEAEYSELGGRVEEIEWMMDSYSAPPVEQSALSQRVDMVELSVRQEQFMHRNIPSGYPMETRKVTSGWGYRIHPVKKLRAFHKGIDLRAKQRRKVYATADGVVRSAYFAKLSGNLVIVSHSFGFESGYAHLSKILVRPGQVVRKGDVVGLSGNTGVSAGPHLHYEVRYLGRAINPGAFLNWEFGNNEIYTQVKEVQWPSLINLISKQITPQTLRLSQLDPASPEQSK